MRDDHATSKRFAPLTEATPMKPAASEALEITEEEAARELAKIAAVVDAIDGTRGPVDANELPVNPRLSGEGDIGAAMGFMPTTSEGIRQTRNALLLSIQTARATGHEAVHYARNRNHYTEFKHNLPHYWTYLNVRRAVDTLLTRPDIVSEFRVRPQNPTPPGFIRKRSVLFAGPKFVDAVVALTEVEVESSSPEQRILRRNRRKELLPITPSLIVNDTDRFFSVFDAAIAHTQFSFSYPAVRWLAPNLATLNHDGWHFMINTNRRYLSRIFTSSMDVGGRFYRGFWQELPKALRATLLIDGGATGEYDYTACHLRLAYFAVGTAGDLDGGTGGDKYTLDGFSSTWRPQIKRAVQILLNARTIRSAVAAIARDLPGQTWEERLETAWALASGIKRRHDAIAPLWHTGCGLGLQYIDSELTRLCATELLARGIVPLPVHDSMVVRSEHVGDLVEVMDRRFQADGRRLAVQRFKGLEQRGFHDHDLTQGRGTILLGRAPPRATTGRLAERSSATCSRLEPSVSAPAAPSDAGTITDANVAPLMHHPLFMDFRSIIRHRKWISAGLAWSALSTSALLYPDRSSAALAVRAWIARMAVDACATVDDACLEAEVLRFLKRAPTPLTPQSIARLCGVTSGMAKRLGLSLVVPTPRKPATTRRAKRMGQTLPRVIDVKKAAAWGSTSRSSWYARHPSGIDRQVAALRAILYSGSAANIAAAREAIHRAKRERSSLLSKCETAADSLLKKLDLLLLIHDLKYSPAAFDADDLHIMHGDRLFSVQWKVTVPSTDRARAQTEELLASFVALSAETGIFCTL
jgi:hypothetical protein